MTKEEFYKELVTHDWFYDYSDDHRVWTQGQNNNERIRKLSSENNDFFVMYNEYIRYINGKREKPTLEEFM